MEPIDALEQGHGYASLGRLAVNVYRGALDEAEGDAAVALRATIATMTALFAGRPSEGDGE